MASKYGEPSNHSCTYEEHSNSNALSRKHLDISGRRSVALGSIRAPVSCRAWKLTFLVRHAVASCVQPVGSNLLLFRACGLCEELSHASSVRLIRRLQHLSGHSGLRR